MSFPEYWISNGTDRPFYARGVFHLDKKVQEAKVHVCGLGQFVLHINGKKAGDHELDPGWADYKKLIEYVTFDVKDLLQEGDNVIGVEVGNGWFIKMDEHYTFTFPSFMPKNPNPYQPYGTCLILALSLVLSYTDGTTEEWNADDSFLVKEHPIIMSNVYGSETMDGRLVQTGWDKTGFDASSWKNAVIVSPSCVPKGKMIEQFQPPIKVIHTYDAAYLHTVNGRKIYDFGQNMSGIISFEAKGKPGDRIALYPAEKLTSTGDVDQVAKGWTTVDSCITYIIGKEEEWEPFRMTFAYFAGRYVALETIPCESHHETDEPIAIRNLRSDAITSAWKTDGQFSCDDVRYEQIYSLVEKAVEANMVSVHTDCPTIERFAWQEPNHLMAPSIFFMKDGQKLWEKFLLDMRMAQHTKEDYFLDQEGNRFYPGEGLMPSQCPCYIPNVLPVPGTGSFYDTIAWGSTCILGTYWHYEFYGDQKIIEDNYDAGMRYLNHLKTKITKEGFICHGLGDWGNPKGEYARENIETAFLYADARTLSYFAHILGKKDDEATLLSFANVIKDNYNAKLLVRHPEKGYWCYRVWDQKDKTVMTQASEALPLFWGMVPEDKESDVVKAFRDTLEQEGAFVSGEIGLPYIINTAEQYDMNDLVEQFILRKEHPSYYAFVLDGETTLGEYWEKNPRSHCHDMMGHIIEWYYTAIAGIKREAPGFARIRIKPYLPTSMHSFSCSYQSVQGTISVRVTEKNGNIELSYHIPTSIDCTVDPTYLLDRGNVTIHACEPI